MYKNGPRHCDRHHSPQHPVQGDRNHGLRVQLQRADGLQVLWQHLQGKDSIVADLKFVQKKKFMRFLPFQRQNCRNRLKAIWGTISFA